MYLYFTFIILFFQAIYKTCLLLLPYWVFRQEVILNYHEMGILAQIAFPIAFLINLFFPILIGLIKGLDKYLSTK